MSKGAVISVTINSDDKTKPGIDSATARFDGFGSKMTGVMAGVGAALGTFALDMGKQLFNAAGDWVDLAKQAEIFGKKSDVVFGDSSADIKKWADEVNESFGLSDEAVVGMAASMGDLLKPMGFTTQATADMTKKMLDGAGALSAWSGGQYDASQVADIMTKAMLGETDGLKALGISISAAEVQARLAAQGQGELTGAALAQAQALATQELIMEKSTDAQKAWTDGTMNAVKEQNSAKAAWEDAKTSLGEGLLPIVQGFTTFLVDKVIPTGQALVAHFKDAWPGIKETVMGVVNPIKDWFVANWPVMRDTVKEAMENIKTVIDTVLTVVKTLWDTFGSYIKTFIGNTFEFIKTIIKAAMDAIKGVIDVVMGIITGDWSRVWDGLKSIVSGVWDLIKGIVQAAIDNVKLVLSGAWDAIKGTAQTAWDGVKSLISGAIDGIVGFVTGIPGRVTSTFSTVWDGLWDNFKGIKDDIKNGIDGIVGFFTGLPGRITSTMGNVFGGIWENFKGAINKIINGWNDLGFTLPKISFDWNGPLPGGDIDVGGWTISTPNIPTLAKGGIVPATPGGRLAIIGEGRYDEAVIPLKPGMTMGNTTYITQNFGPGVTAENVAVVNRNLFERGYRP